MEVGWLTFDSYHHIYLQRWSWPMELIVRVRTKLKQTHFQVCYSDSLKENWSFTTSTTLDIPMVTKGSPVPKYRKVTQRRLLGDIDCLSLASFIFVCEIIIGKCSALARPATLLKKRLWRRCFLRNFKNTFFTGHLQWLLLSFTNIYFLSKWYFSFSWHSEWYPDISPWTIAPQTIPLHEVSHRTITSQTFAPRTITHY